MAHVVPIQLAERESEVLQMVFDKVPIEEMAERLRVSNRTVVHHVRNIGAKFLLGAMFVHTEMWPDEPRPEWFR
jgi:DNA-binding NarL/FixJ family response regulator